MDIRYLTLCLTTGCNLSCRYCYHGDITLARDMTPEVMNKALDLVRQGEGPFHLQMTGGEPTRVPRLVKLAVRLAKNTGRPCTLGFQTNGTGFSRDLVGFFKKTGVQVGVSVDGPPQVHQRLRGSAGKTMKGLVMLEENGLPFRVTTVVTAENVMSLDKLVLMLSGFSMARGIALDLLVRKGRAKTENGVAPAGIDAIRNAVASMLQTLDAVNSRRDNPLSFRERDLLFKKKPGSMGSRHFCHAATGNSVAVHPDGRLFPCGQTLGQREFQAGTVWEPLAKRLGRLAEFKLASQACDTCPVSDHCPGDCPSRLMFNRNGNGADCVCELYRTIWNAEKNKP